MNCPPIALVTYSTKPRGGVVHTLALAEALHAMGAPIRVVALGDPAAGFFRAVRAPLTIVPAPGGSSLEDKVARSIDRMAEALTAVDAELLHTQDCISARAAARVRDSGALVRVLRTVHHVDDFSSQVLIDCQAAAILEPDAVLVVSQMWRRILWSDYGVAATVVPNGVDVARFAATPRARCEEVASRVGDGRRPLLLSVGGIEPRKGSDNLMRALGVLKREMVCPPVLAVIGGHSFQDYRTYREGVLDELAGLGLELGVDVLLVGTVPDEELPAWYAAAGALAFPSIKEGFGLAVLEAMSAGTPVVTSDLPVFREYLVHGRDALLVPPGDVAALASALNSALVDSTLRAGLVAAGHEVAARFTWVESARRHLDFYVGQGQQWQASFGKVATPRR